MSQWWWGSRKKKKKKMNGNKGCKETKRNAQSKLCESDLGTRQRKACRTLAHEKKKSDTFFTKRQQKVEGKSDRKGQRKKGDGQKGRSDKYLNGAGAHKTKLKSKENGE